MLYPSAPTLTQHLARAAEQAPDRTALIHDNGAMSFAELDALSRRYAAGLCALGLGVGDRVALWLPNTPEHYALAYAVWRIGGVVLGVNTRFKAKEVEDIVGRAGAKLLAYQPGFKDIDFAGILAGVDPAALTALERVVTFGESEAREVLGRPATPLAELETHGALDEDFATPDTPCQIFTTSGTTSRPKFVLHAHRTLGLHAERLPAYWGLDRRMGCCFRRPPFAASLG